MLRRLAAIILCVIMLFGLVACGDSNVEYKDCEVTVMDIAEQKWNKMWDLWAEGKAESPYAELMTYQAEVNNGGHDQYFFNVSNTGDLEVEMTVLVQILPETHKVNMEKAYEAYLALEENEDDETAAAVLEQCDSVFWENEAEINGVLEEYAAKIVQ